MIQLQRINPLKIAALVIQLDPLIKLSHLELLLLLVIQTQITRVHKQTYQFVLLLHVECHLRQFYHRQNRCQFVVFGYVQVHQRFEC